MEEVFSPHDELRNSCPSPPPPKKSNYKKFVVSPPLFFVLSRSGKTFFLLDFDTVSHRTLFGRESLAGSTDFSPTFWSKCGFSEKIQKTPWRHLPSLKVGGGGSKERKKEKRSLCSSLGQTDYISIPFPSLSFVSLSLSTLSLFFEVSASRRRKMEV